MTPGAGGDMDWVDRLAEALQLEPLSGQEVNRLLRASRDVAHRVERKATPLTAYLVGLAVGRGVAQGASREAALGDALDAVLVRLPETPAAEEPRGGEAPGAPER
jgi:Domain of unknown function (DUF6457)